MASTTMSIHEACVAGNISAVLECLKANPESYKQLNSEGKNAATVAREANQPEIATLLQKLPVDVLQLRDTLIRLEEEVNVKQAKTMAMRGERKAALEALENDRVVKVKQLMDQIKLVEADIAAKKEEALLRSKADMDRNMADLEQTSVLLETARRLDSQYVDRLVSNLANTNCEETYVLLARAGVHAPLEKMQEQQVNGEVLQHNYKDAAMLNSIGITQLGQRMRCQQLVEHLVAGRSLATFRFNEAVVPENEAFAGSFETWPAWRVAQFITEPAETSAGAAAAAAAPPSEAQLNAARLAAQHFTTQQIAGDVLDRPEFAELLKGNLGNVPFGAMDVAVRKCLRLVAENPRTGFVAPTLQEIKTALANYEPFQSQKLEVCTRLSTIKATIPESLRCKLTDSLMDEAVMTDDGMVYDRFAITYWFDLQRKSAPSTVPAARVRLTSPLTGAVITDRLRPCTAMNEAIYALIFGSDPVAA